MAEVSEPIVRVFFALWPSATLAAQLGEIARQQAAVAGGKATRPETIHLTLAFIGNLPETRLAELIAAVQGLSAPGFTLTLDQLGHWSHKRLAWAGCQQPPAALASLVTALHQRLQQATFTVDRLPGQFFPHVTLVRKTTQAAPSGPLQPPLRWPCSEFVLVRSHLSAAGSDYEILARWPLG